MKTVNNTEGRTPGNKFSVSNKSMICMDLKKIYHTPKKRLKAHNEYRSLRPYKSKRFSEGDKSRILATSSDDLTL